MLSVSKEEFEALRRRNFRLLFVVGPSGSGKSTLCTRIVNDYKWSHINIDQLISQHKANKTKLGELILSHSGKVTFDLVIKVLVQAIVTSQNKNYLVEGFPSDLESALYFEKNIREIGVILNLDCSEEVCLTRLLKLGGEEESSRKQIIESKINLTILTDFYNKYGIVRTINSEEEVGKVYEVLREALYPTVNLILGKKYSGKSFLANTLCEKMRMKLIDFKDLPSGNESSQVNTLINKLREESALNVIVEDFPLKKEQINHFMKNCKKFERVFYLNIEDQNAYERMSKCSTDSNIGCSALNSLLFDFDSKKEVLDFLKLRTNFIEVDVNNYPQVIIDDMMSKISPSVLIFSHNKDEENSNNVLSDLVNYFTNSLNYVVVDVLTVIEENIKRQTVIGKKLESTSDFPTDLLLTALKPVIFNPNQNKFILNNFPSKQSELEAFESTLCKITKLVYVTSPVNSLQIEEESIEVYMKRENRLFVYSRSEVDEYVVNDILDKNRDISIVYGMPLSGKTKICEHLKNKYNYTLIDFAEFIIELKKVKGLAQDPPSEPDAVELNTQELLDGFQKHISSLSLGQKILLDNIFAGKNELIVDLDSFRKLLDITGRLRQFYELTCKEEVLLDRWKETKGISEDVGEDQKAEFVETLDKPKKIVEMLKSAAFKVTPIDTNYSEAKSKMLFDSANGVKLVVVKHDYDLNIINSLYLFAARRRAMLVSLPDIIRKHFWMNKSTAKRLYDSYSKKNLINFNSDDVNAENVRVKSSSADTYYRYNPIHFDEEIIQEILSKYIADNSKEIEESGNFVILCGYLNHDLLYPNDSCFSLPLYEVKKVIALGELTAFVQLTFENLKAEEDEVAEKPYVEPPKQKVKDPLDVDAEGDNATAQEENQDNADGQGEDVPKFKPENFAWTWYDGTPRNYVQTLLRLKKLPLLQDSCAEDEVNRTLLSTLDLHFSNWQDEQYAGVITLTNIERKNK